MSARNRAREVKMAMLAILVLPLMYLGWTAVAVVFRRSGLDGQRRTARLYRSALRLHLGDRQQRFRPSPAFPATPVLQPRACERDVRRPLFMIVRRMARRVAGGQKIHPPSAGTLRPPARPVVGVILEFNRRLTFLPHCTSADRRAPRDEMRTPVLTGSLFGVPSMEA